MQEIKCPKCGEIFQVDESGYAEIVRQVRDKEFRQELERRETELTEKKDSELRLVRAEQERVLESRLAEQKEAASKRELEQKEESAERERRLREEAEKGNERAMLAYEMYSNSVKKYIGQYIAVMGGVDAIVLAGGVGENDPKMRRMIFAGLQTMGIILDLKANSAKERGEREISSFRSDVRIVIIPTDEEYMIARDTFEIVHDKIGEGGVRDEFSIISA